MHGPGLGLGLEEVYICTASILEFKCLLLEAQYPLINLKCSAAT